MISLLVLALALAGAPVDDVVSVLHPTDGGLTAERVAARALVDAPDVRLRVAELETAAARVDQARAQYMPALDLSAQYMRLSPLPGGTSGALTGTLNPGPLTVGACPDGTAGCVVDSQGVPALSQTFQFASIQNTYALAAVVGIPISDDLFTIPHAVQAAKHGERAATLARDIERIDTAVDAQIAFYNWVRAQANLELAERSAARIDERIDEAQVRQRAGIITATDVLRLQAQLAAAQRSVAEAESFVAITAEDLGARTALDPMELTLGEDVTAAFASDLERGATKVLVDEALGRRLELALLRASDATLREQIAVARTQYAPRLDLVGRVDTANPNQRLVPQQDAFNTTWAAGVSLSYDVRAAVGTRARIQSSGHSDAPWRLRSPGSSAGFVCRWCKPSTASAQPVAPSSSTAWPSRARRRLTTRSPPGTRLARSEWSTSWRPSPSVWKPSCARWSHTSRCESRTCGCDTRWVRSFRSRGDDGVVARRRDPAYPPARPWRRCCRAHLRGGSPPI